MAYESVPWSLEAEAAALARMDIGLMPLPDIEWNRGKCGYKALQYMAAGVPVVADDVGVARELVGEGGVVGEDWTETLRTLGTDAATRTVLGAAGRARVEHHYSVARWAPTLATLLRGDLMAADTV
jgi:glycosyltransferase involved in cell wall biosynthesis